MLRRLRTTRPGSIIIVFRNFTSIHYLEVTKGWELAMGLGYGLNHHEAGLCKSSSKNIKINWEVMLMAHQDHYMSLTKNGS